MVVQSYAHTVVTYSQVDPISNMANVLQSKKNFSSLFRLFHCALNIPHYADEDFVESFNRNIPLPLVLKGPGPSILQKLNKYELP